MRIHDLLERRLQPANDDDASIRAGLARDKLGLDIPIFRGLGQFTLYILSLGKQTLCTRFQTADARARADRLAEPAPARVTTSRLGREVLHEILNPHSVDHGRELQGALTASRRNAAFLPMLSTRWTAAPARPASAQAMTSPGKAGAGAEIDPASGLRRQRQELQRIGDVAGPDVRDGRARDQVDVRLPHQQELPTKQVQLRRCFT